MVWNVLHRQVGGLGVAAESNALDHLVHIVAQAFRVYADCILFEHLKQVLLYIFEH